MKKRLSDFWSCFIPVKMIKDFCVLRFSPKKYKREPVGIIPITCTKLLKRHIRLTCFYPRKVGLMFVLY